MRPIATVAVVTSLVLVGGAHLFARSGPDHSSELSNAAKPSGAPPSTSTASPNLSRIAPGPRPAVEPVAARWVTSMWSRQPGDVDWLDLVGDITDPALEAALRSVRPSLVDDATVSQVVDVIGVYPDSRDPMTLTVTCVVHRIADGVREDRSCAATVTLAFAEDGRVVVAAVR